jgi:hypothetical protein
LRIFTRRSVLQGAGVEFIIIGGVAGALHGDQAHDHVLAEKERKRGAFIATCSYILHNPVRAELVKKPEDWPHFGAVIAGYPKSDPLKAKFWPTFWKIYFKARHPDCTKRTLPPRS